MRTTALDTPDHPPGADETDPGEADPRASVPGDGPQQGTQMMSGFHDHLQQPMGHGRERVAEEMQVSIDHLLGIEHVLEKILSTPATRAHVGYVQNIDLVCQTLEDVARILRFISALTPSDAELDSQEIGEKIKLADVRHRLLGIAQSAHEPEQASGHVDLF